MLIETVFHDDDETLEFVWDDDRFAGVLKSRNGHVEAWPEGGKARQFASRQDAIDHLAFP